MTPATRNVLRAVARALARANSAVSPASIAKDRYSPLAQLISPKSGHSLRVTVTFGYQRHRARNGHDSPELFTARYEMPKGATFLTLSQLRDDKRMTKAFPLPPSLNNRGYMPSGWESKRNVHREWIAAYTTLKPHERNSYNNRGKAHSNVIDNAKQRFINAVRDLFLSQSFILTKDINDIPTNGTTTTMEFLRTSRESQAFREELQKKHPFVFWKHTLAQDWNNPPRANNEELELRAAEHARKRAARNRKTALNKLRSTNPSYLAPRDASKWKGQGHQNLAVPILGGDILVFQGHGAALNNRHIVPKGVRILFPCREGEKASTFLQKGVAWPVVTDMNYIKKGRVPGYKRTNRTALLRLMKNGSLEGYASYLANIGHNPEIKVAGNSYADLMLQRYSSANKKSLGANNTSVYLPGTNANERERELGANNTSVYLPGTNANKRALGANNTSVNKKVSYKLSNIINYQLRLRNGKPFDLVVHACRAKLGR